MRCKDGCRLSYCTLIQDISVYSPEPNFLPHAIRELPPLNDHEYVDKHYGNMSVKPYCLPPVREVKNRIVYWVMIFLLLPPVPIAISSSLV